MKKLEKLNSKLFEAFQMDEVSSLASVVGGVKCATNMPDGPHYDEILDNTGGAANDLRIGTSKACDSTRYTDDKNCPNGGSSGTGLMAFSEDDVMPIEYFDETLILFDSSLFVNN